MMQQLNRNFIMDKMNKKRHFDYMNKYINEMQMRFSPQIMSHSFGMSSNGSRGRGRAKKGGRDQILGEFSPSRMAAKQSKMLRELKHISNKLSSIKNKNNYFASRNANAKRMITTIEEYLYKIKKTIAHRN